MFCNLTQPKPLSLNGLNGISEPRQEQKTVDIGISQHRVFVRGDFGKILVPGICTCAAHTVAYRDIVDGKEKVYVAHLNCGSLNCGQRQELIKIAAQAEPGSIMSIYCAGDKAKFADTYADDIGEINKILKVESKVYFSTPLVTVECERFELEMILDDDERASCSEIKLPLITTPAEQKSQI